MSYVCKKEQNHAKILWLHYVRWVRLQLVEWRHLNATLGEHSFRLGTYWKRRLSAAQGRYLRAVETLARVRRLNVSVQVTIANQQIIAGGK